MKVIVLAAGRSKRLKPIEDKNFLVFCGRPLIEHQLGQLIKAGVQEILLIGGKHNLEQLHEVASRFSREISVTVLEQKNLDDGMAGALLSAKSSVNHDALLIVSSNDIVDLSAYQMVLETIKDKKNDGLLLAKKVDRYFPGGYLQMGKNGFLSGIVEKPGAGNEPSDLVNLVVHFHRNSDALFEALERTNTTRDDHYEAAMDAMLKSGFKLKAVAYDGFWKPIKFPWDVLTVMDHFLERMKPSPKNGSNAKSVGKKTRPLKVEIAKTATLTGNVILEDGVRILANAVIIGPAYIGKNTVVATNALIRGSMIGENCVVGFGTEIARSHLGNDVWTHSNYIGDSIIGSDNSFGAGTVTGNLRLDEGTIKVMIQGERIDSGKNKFGIVSGDHVRCGINTSFMPGIKIGNHSAVGAGIVVASDVPDKKIVYAKTELLMKDSNLQLDVSSREKMKNRLGTS